MVLLRGLVKPKVDIGKSSDDKHRLLEQIERQYKVEANVYAQSIKAPIRRIKL